MSASTANNLTVLAGLLRELLPERTLEIGLAGGASTIVFARYHAESGGQHIAIDPFQDTVWEGAGTAALTAHALSEYVTCLRDFSCAALPAMLKRSDRYGLVYVDGSHLFEDVFVDAYYVSRLLSLGGVVAFDDSTDPHVRKALRFVRRDMPCLEEIDLAKYRPQTRLRYRVARLLGRAQMTAFRKVSDARRPWDSRLVNF